MTEALVTVIILTYNEDQHIERAISSVRPFARKVIVVDSFSTDGTVKMAEAEGAVVLQNRFVNQAKQFQWALDHCGATSGWIMRLDADEVIDPSLVAEISGKLSKLPSDVVGVNLNRRHIFDGKWIRFGGRFPLLMLRLWRVGHGHVEDRWMDEHVVVSGGRTVTFEGTFSDHNLNDLTYFVDKHNKYATREAIEVINQRRGLLNRDGEALNSESASMQAAMKRWVKERIYNKIPYQISSTVYFLFRYIIQLGFLDGKQGLVYHGLQGWWYRFLVGAKVEELEKQLVGLTDKQEVLARLSQLTGHKLT